MTAPSTFRRRSTATETLRQRLAIVEDDLRATRAALMAFTDTEAGDEDDAC